MPTPKRKNGQPMRRYASIDPEYGTAEQRLASGVVQEGGVGALLSLMEYIQPKTGASIYDTASSPQARAFRSEGDAIMIQRPGEDGEYLDRGRRLTTQDLEYVTGFADEVASKDRKTLNALLQNPDVLRYFMDIYNEAGEYDKAKTYKARKPIEGRLGGGTTGRPDPSCKGGGCWTGN